MIICILEVSQTIAPVVEIKLPEIGQPLRNVNIFVSQSDPILQPDSEYPEWIWAARGPCRALLPSKNTLFPAPTDTDDTEALKKFLRHENRKVIRKNNFTLKGASN